MASSAPRPGRDAAGTHRLSTPPLRLGLTDRLARHHAARSAGQRFDAADQLLGSTATRAAISQVPAQIYGFGTVGGVSRVDVQVLSASGRIEIREVAFNGQSCSANAVPEPGSLALAGPGLVLAVARRRRGAACRLRLRARRGAGDRDQPKPWPMSTRTAAGSRRRMKRIASGTSTMSSMTPKKGMTSGIRSIGEIT